MYCVIYKICLDKALNVLFPTKNLSDNAIFSLIFPFFLVKEYINLHKNSIFLFLKNPDS